MGDYILKLKDSFLTDVRMKHECYDSGYDDVDYVSFDSFTLQLSNGIIYYSTDTFIGEMPENEEETDTLSDFMKLIINNKEVLQAMTEKEFVSWLMTKLKKIYKDTLYEFKYINYKELEKTKEERRNKIIKLRRKLQMHREIKIMKERKENSNI